MGSIPLPNDSQPLIAPADPLSAYQRAQAMLQQRQLQQQSLQSGDLENQQRQIQLKQQQKDAEDQQKISDAYMQANGDMTKTVELAAKGGVSPATVLKLRQADMQGRQQLATLTKDQQENLKRTMEMVGQGSQAVLSLPPDQRPAALQKSVMEMAQAGAVPPDQAQQLLQSAPVGDPGKLEQWLKVHGMAAMNTKDQLDQLDKAQQRDETHRHNVATEEQPTEVRLAERAAGGDKLASAALNRLDQSKRSARAVTSIMTNNDAKDIADAIANGDQPPTLQGLYRNAGPVRAELARRGVPMAQMETDWKATQKYVGTLNGPQQVRLRQAITTASDSVDKIDQLYNEYHSIVGDTGMKAFNKAGLATAKQLPGRAGAVATALDAQIADLTSELGNVYMGGNSPTDHSLSLAAKNLSSDWNKATFEEGLKQIHQNIKIRQNSITHSAPAGTSGESNYYPQQGGGQPAVAAPASQGGDFFSKFGGKPR